jgi:PilZ domain
MTSEPLCKTPPRRHQRISLPKGMDVTWYGAGDQQVSRVKTIGMGGLFLSGSRVKPVGTTLKLVFEVPGGMVFADAIVRNTLPGEGMGVEFTRISPQDRALLAQLLGRLLR